MPTRKQRRRQQKSRRHEYEYVYVDDEGQEVAVDPAELRVEKNGNRTESRPRKADKRPPTSGRAGRRPIAPPSWRRSARRALLLGPILVVAMMLLNRNVSLAQQIAPAVLMVSVFIPFSYFTDSLAYRMYRRRVDAGGAPKRR
jgi:hypothetical protein